jgi:hypothetical protein
MNSTLLRIVVLVLVSVLAVIANADRANRYGSSLFANGVAAVVGESDPEVSIEMLTDAADPPVNTQTGIFKSTAARPSGTPIPACALPVLPHSGGATSSAQAPSTRYARSRGVYLIRATELAAAGYLPGSSPTILEWNYQTGPGILGSAPLRIYLENTTDTNYTKPLSFNSALAGMTPVHNATTMLPATAGIFDVYFSGGVPFTYTGGGLYVAFDWGPYEGTRSTTAKVYYALGFANGFAGNSTGDDALTANSLRPETRLNGSPSPQFDAAVSTVYSIGEIPLGRAPLQTISALVTNNGTQSLTDLPVTLNISGSHTFTDTQVLPFLGSCGRQAMVTFNLFEPTTLGSDTVTVSVPADEVSANNSVSKALNVTANEYSYRYPGSTANGAVGLGAPGVYAAKFAVPSAESVEAVKLEFWVVTAATYRIAIFADNGGSPSNIPLYVDSFDRTIDAAGVITITLPTPVAVHGTFYVGMYQTSTEPAFIALESEIPLRTGTFFRSDSSFQPWFDVSPSRYKFNIGVVLNN